MCLEFGLMILVVLCFDLLLCKYSGKWFKCFAFGCFVKFVSCFSKVKFFVLFLKCVVKCFEFNSFCFNF